VKSNIYNIILGCLLASFFIACGGQEEKQVEKSCEADEIEVSPVNPNGDSELALLMRQLYFDADTIKQLIVNEEGNISDELIAELERIHTATPTDPEVKTDEFKAYNELMINQAKALKETTANKKDAFNLFVNRCIDCHQSFCPGPIVRIKKLVIH
jgi:hypothetical protein